MKIQVNGSVSNEALKTILEEQHQKIETIDLFCKEKKVNSLSYKDSILEYEYSPKPVKKVEVRQIEKRDETR